MIEIREGALFLADSHYPHHGDEFLILLQKLLDREIDAPQLFLMGDNFDLLFGYNDYIQTFSSDVIALLKKLSKTLEIHYLEGNHDFLLKNIFTNIKIYDRDQQPVACRLGEKRVAISHGDRYATGFAYDFYCKMLRNKTAMTLLKPFERRIINHYMTQLSQKHICRQLRGFRKKAEKILKYYDNADMVIEGHFHQAVVIGKYISLPSLACQKKVGVARGSKVVFETISNL